MIFKDCQFVGPPNEMALYDEELTFIADVWQRLSDAANKAVETESRPKELVAAVLWRHRMAVELAEDQINAHPGGKCGRLQSYLRDFAQRLSDDCYALGGNGAKETPDVHRGEP